MSRLIDADALKEELKEIYHTEPVFIYTTVHEAIDNAPTVETSQERIMAYKDGYEQGRYDEMVETEISLPKWIPVSERLPEEDGEYLVESTRGYEVLYYREEEKQFGLMVFNFAGKVGFVPKKVYEWMPIPGVEE